MRLDAYFGLAPAIMHLYVSWKGEVGLLPHRVVLLLL